MQYESVVRKESQAVAGAWFTIARMSFARRLELTRRIHELAKKMEFLEAGERPEEKIAASLVEGEIERLYLEWGLREVGGLEIDGRPATPETLMADGPEELCTEILEAIKKECGLSEEERKN